MMQVTCLKCACEIIWNRHNAFRGVRRLMCVHCEWNERKCVDFKCIRKPIIRAGL